MVNTQLFGIPEGGKRLALHCDVEPVDPYQLHRGTPCGRVGVCSIEVVLKHRQCEDVRHLEKKQKACIIHEDRTRSNSENKNNSRAAKPGCGEASLQPKVTGAVMET